MSNTNPYKHIEDRLLDRLKKYVNPRVDAGVKKAQATPTPDLSVTTAKLVNRNITTAKINFEAVGENELAAYFFGGSGDQYRLRALGGGVSPHASALDHAHSVNFKTHMNQEKRKEVLSEVHAVEAKPLASRTPVEVLILRVIRMMIDEPDMTAEALVDFLDNGDREEVHEWRLAHEADYMVRWYYEYDERYRTEIGGDPRVQAALSRMPKEAVENDPAIVERSKQRNDLPQAGATPAQNA